MAASKAKQTLKELRTSLKRATLTCAFACGQKPLVRGAKPAKSVQVVLHPGLKIRVHTITATFSKFIYKALGPMSPKKLRAPLLVKSVASFTVTLTHRVAPVPPGKSRFRQRFPTHRTRPHEIKARRRSRASLSNLSGLHGRLP